MGLLVGLPEHSGTLQLLSHHEDLFQRSFIQQGQGGGLLGFLSSGGETLFSTLSFLALVGTFTFTRNTSLVLGVVPFSLGVSKVSSPESGVCAGLQLAVSNTVESWVSLQRKRVCGDAASTWLWLSRRVVPRGLSTHRCPLEACQNRHCGAHRSL